MRMLWILLRKELRDGVRNRWVAACVLLLGILALSLSVLGSAPAGSIRISALDASVISLASLSVYLIPLIALMLSFDALVGEFERGTMMLLLTYPIARWQVILGKFLGQVSILLLAILGGYGGSALILALVTDNASQGWQAYGLMMISSLVLGAVFIALGHLVSILVRERATAAGIAIGLWLIFVVLYDLVLFGALTLDEGQNISQQLFTILMLINPTDSYRIFNLSLIEGVSQASGMAGVASEAGLSFELLSAVLLLWVILPLSATLVLFQRREI